MYLYYMPVIHNDLYDVLDSIGGTAESVSDFFSNVGEWCAKVINGSLSAFSKLVYSAINILTADPESEIFSDFWSVINRVGAVLSVIASTLMVLLFLINMATDAWDSRHEFELWSVVKQIAKMTVAVIIVNNAVLIVTSLFAMGAKLAGIITLSGEGRQGMSSLQLDPGYEGFIQYGVTGASGIMMFLVFLFAALIIIACAVMICMEIYQRIFKIYILIPFSTISFTTFVMGDGNRGNQVFHDYLKSIMTTAIEAVLIILCITFTHKLIESTDTMNTLFPAINEEEVSTVYCNHIDDGAALMAYVSHNYSMLTQALQNEDITISDSVRTFIGDFSGNRHQMGANSYSSIVIEGRCCTTLNEYITCITFGHIPNDGGFYATLYPEFTWKSVFMIILQLLFPCILCACTVKLVSNYSGMILGR